MTPQSHLADPWRVQIAMLPIRYQYPDDARNAYSKATQARAAATSAAQAKRRDATEATIVALLQKHGELNAQQVAAKMDFAKGYIYEVLRNMGAADTLRFRVDAAMVKHWRLAE